jgi:hypothetical protein
VTVLGVGAQVAERSVLKSRNPPSKPPVDWTEPSSFARRAGRAVHNHAVGELDPPILLKRRLVRGTATLAKHKALVWFKDTASDQLRK